MLRRLSLPAFFDRLHSSCPSSFRSSTRFDSSPDHARRCTSKSWRSVINSGWSTERAVRVSN
jgi:hypothetical protein